MAKKVILILFLSLFQILYANNSCPLNQNLIRGGSFENDFDLNEWSVVSGDATPSLQKYSSGWAGTPPNGAGEVFLYARGESVTLKQSIDLSNCNFTEDYSYDFSVYLGGNGDGDTARVQVILKDENGNAIDGYDTDYQTSDHQMNKFNHAFAYSNNIKEADIIIKIDNNFFNWWDNDADGYVDLVSLKVVKTQYLEGFQDFEIVNPSNSRIIRGNFAIAGNTVMCLTDKTDGFGGTCQDDSVKYKTSNLRVSKYLDIDNDDSTWNSTSSYIELPSNYDEKNDGTGIVWAGLFWQGRVSWDNDHPLRYGVSPFNGENYIRTDGGSFDIENSNANKILLKINNKDYQNVEANKLAYYTYSNGTTYAAYADVTKLLQEAKLKKGKNSFQIANLLTNEGRENSPGIFGGWSLVVIYKEDLSGKVRSINSYFGFRDIYEDTPIKISGLKLPKSGDVSSKAALFSGEGEYLYGKNEYDYRSYDWIKISNNKYYNYQYMPDANGNPLPTEGVGNRDNIFDAHLSGVKRDHIDGKFNDLQTNNNGVDIDIFNLSSIMKEYRDENSEIDTIYLKMFSNNDYVTPSMITFATELYTPKVCYDYALYDGNYTVINDNNRFFSKSANGKPLIVKLTIRSQETDFDLENSKLRIKFDPSIPQYIQGSAKYTEPNTNAYENALEIDTQTGLIAIGNNPTINGGTISANETSYVMESFDVDKDFNGTFNIELETKINFSSSSINYNLTLDRCPTNPIYDPVYWRFNIEKDDVDFDTPEPERYSLPTRVAGKPFKVSLASYKKDRNGEYTIPNRVLATVELEIINAGGFDNNSSAGFDTVCEEPSSIGEGVFVKLNYQDRKVIKIPDDYPTYPSNLALRNATFRMWVLTKKVNGVTKFINHMCNSAYDNRCFTAVYASMYENYDNLHLCLDSCNPHSAIFDPNSRKCYDCLKKYFAKPVCARDNFAIRPQSFHISLSDNNETKSAEKIDIADNNRSNNTINIAAGYLYRLDINATLYNSLANTIGYAFNSILNPDNIAILQFNDISTCYDKYNKNLEVILDDGITKKHTSSNDSYSAINGLISNNTGKYKLHIEDKSWTLVDQKGYIYKPFKDVDDCILDSSITQNEGLQGCNISSDYIFNDLNIKTYPYKFEMDVDISNSLYPTFNYIYASNLNNTANSLKDKVMALKVSGNIIAKGKNNVILTNYTKNCAADDLILNYDFNTSKKPLQDMYGNQLSLDYFLYKDEFSEINVKHNLTKDVNISYPKDYFKNTLYGVSNLNSFINVDRNFNKPINPFKIDFNRVKIYLDKAITADLNRSFKPKGIKDINKSMYVYYGKISSPIKFYDNVYENRINTPIYFEIFCNEAIDKCKEMGVSMDVSKTNEINWWINKEFTIPQFNDYLKTDDQNATIIRANKDIEKGEDKNIFIVDNNTTKKPYSVTIKPTNSFINNYPWLLYNEFKNIPSDYLFKVRFVGQEDAWSGSGNSGYTIDAYKAGSKKTHKIDW